MAKRQIKTPTDALTVPGPLPDSSLKYLQYSFAGMPNLYLAVFFNGARVLQFKQTRLGKVYFVTIGTLGKITLDEGFQKTIQYREMIMNGIDPRQAFKVSRSMLFSKFVEQDYWPFAIKRYKTHLNIRNMLDNRILPAFGSFHLKDIHRVMVRIFHQSICEEINPRTGANIGGATANRNLFVISSVFNLAIDHDLVDLNPCVGIRKAPENKSRGRYLSHDERIQFVLAAMSLIDRPQTKAILIILALGVRPSEIFKLTLQDLQLTDNRIFIRDPKNGESRFVTLNSIAREIFCQLYDEKKAGAKWVFPSSSAKGHILSVRKTFKAICDKAQITDFQLRDLRRSHATLLLQSGVDLFTIREILGHKSLQSTQVYARVTSQRMAEANELAASKISAVINGQPELEQSL